MGCLRRYMLRKTYLSILYNDVPSTTDRKFQVALVFNVKVCDYSVIHQDDSVPEINKLLVYDWVLCSCITRALSCTSDPSIAILELIGQKTSNVGQNPKTQISYLVGEAVFSGCSTTSSETFLLA